MYITQLFAVAVFWWPRPTPGADGSPWPSWPARVQPVLQCAGPVLGHDRASESRVQGAACQGHLGPEMQQAAVHELPGGPQSAGSGSPREGGPGEPLGQDQAGSSLFVQKPFQWRRLVPQGRWWHVRGCREPEIHAPGPQSHWPCLLWLQVQALCEAGLHVWRSGIRAIKGGAWQTRHKGAGGHLRTSMQERRRRGRGRRNGEVHGGARGQGRRLEVVHQAFLHQYFSI